MADTTPSATNATAHARAPRKATTGTPRAAGRAGARQTRREALLAQAQRPVLIPVGAALVARDNLANAVRRYARPAAARRELAEQLDRFERRGVSARDAVQRELRHRRAQAGRLVGAVPRRGRQPQRDERGAWPG
jgi:hypothetical protein